VPFVLPFTGAGDQFGVDAQLKHHDAKIHVEIPLLTEQDER
jgi:hypothetical protein